jgi:hypothetical protein
MIAINGHKIDKLAIGGHKVTAMAKGGVKIYGINEQSDCFLYKITMQEGAPLSVRRYFANEMAVDWGLGNGYEPLNISAGSIQQKFYSAGVYNIRIKKTSGDRYLFSSSSTSGWLIGVGSSTFLNSYSDLLAMPPFPLFGDSETNVGHYFFKYFNLYGSQRISRLPAGSFDTSKIQTAGSDFFHNAMGGAKSPIEYLPAGSFRFDHLKTVGSHFFNRFLQNSPVIKGLPAGSFNTEGITIQSGDFMVYFFIDGPPMPYTISATADPTKVNIKNITPSSVAFGPTTSTYVPAGQYIQFNVNAVN